MKTIDEKMMALALAEARKGWGSTSPNPMVGAVVAREDRVVAKGFHARAGMPHAEVEALTRAGDLARGATLYVTLEPCNHQGRTPPCTKAVLEAGIARVVIGHHDPNPGVAGGGAEFLRSRGLEVKTGVLEENCRELIEFFLKFVTTRLPFVLLKSAGTLDGKIATKTGHSRWVTGEKARKFVHEIRHGVDAILVGRGTVEKDDPALSTRLDGVRPGRDPVRVILDTGLKLDPARKVFDPKTGGKTIVACGQEYDREKARVLNDLGVTVWPLPLCGPRVGLTALLSRLGRENLTSLLIEGGSQVNYSALVEEKIVDKIMFFYAPKIIGGNTAPTLVDGQGLASMDQALNFDIIRIKRLGPDILIEAIPRGK